MRPNKRHHHVLLANLGSIGSHCPQRLTFAATARCVVDYRLLEYHSGLAAVRIRHTRVGAPCLSQPVSPQLGVKRVPQTGTGNIRDSLTCSITT